MKVGHNPLRHIFEGRVYRGVTSSILSECIPGKRIGDDEELTVHRNVLWPVFQITFQRVYSQLENAVHEHEPT